MNGVSPRRPWGFLIVLTLSVATPAANADALSVVAMLRAGGCGGILPIAPPLRRNASLDPAAEQWADGHSLDPGTQGVRASGSDEALIRELRSGNCRTVSSRELREVGIYRRGAETWLVLSSVSRKHSRHGRKTGTPTIRVMASLASARCC